MIVVINGGHVWSHQRTPLVILEGGWHHGVKEVVGKIQVYGPLMGNFKKSTN